MLSDPMLSSCMSFQRTQRTQRTRRTRRTQRSVSPEGSQTTYIFACLRLKIRSPSDSWRLKILHDLQSMMYCIYQLRVVVSPVASSFEEATQKFSLSPASLGRRATRIVWPFRGIRLAVRNALLIGRSSILFVCGFCMRTLLCSYQ